MCWVCVMSCIVSCMMIDDRADGLTEPTTDNWQLTAPNHEAPRQGQSRVSLAPALLLHSCPPASCGIVYQFASLEGASHSFLDFVFFWVSTHTLNHSLFKSSARNSELHSTVVSSCTLVFIYSVSSVLQEGYFSAIISVLFCYFKIRKLETENSKFSSMTFGSCSVSSVTSSVESAVCAAQYCKNTVAIYGPILLRDSNRTVFSVFGSLMLVLWVWTQNNRTIKS